MGKIPGLGKRFCFCLKNMLLDINNKPRKTS